VTLLEQIKEAIEEAQANKQELEAQKFRNSQLYLAMKIVARQNGGKIDWTAQELLEAKQDERCIVLGALGFELYDESPKS
jgi:hypothetical protein